jgi:hypothetical protein
MTNLKLTNEELGYVFLSVCEKIEMKKDTMRMFNLAKGQFNKKDVKLINDVFEKDLKKLETLLGKFKEGAKYVPKNFNKARRQIINNRDRLQEATGSNNKSTRH